MANNMQWLYENNSRVRYSAAGLTRDNGIKMLVGKAPFASVQGSNFVYVDIYFGTYFTSGCKPVVVAGVESNSDGYTHRSHVVVQGLGGEIDGRGFTAIVANEPYTKQGPGWVTYTAVGY